MSILIQQFRSIGVRYLTGYDVETGLPVKRKCYNGRLCFVKNGKRVGLKSVEKFGRLAVMKKMER